MDLSNVLNVTKVLAVEAGHKIMEIYDRDFEISYKENESPLTEADEAADTIIKVGLIKAFPEVSILSEEGKDNKDRLNNAWCFIVDPLDGTKEFINRNGQFTVNIALAHNNRVVSGVIYVPVTRELYYAAEGIGAYIKDLKTDEERTISVTEKTTDLIMVGSKSHAKPEEKKLAEKHKDIISDTMVAGSSLKGCMVARGEADVYYRFGLTCEWDTAAMQTIVEQAGGIFKQMDGSEMTYNREDNLNAKGFYVVNCKENIWV